MHIYAFGSLCRGEVDAHSDVDLLALVDEFDPRFDPKTFSIYSYTRILELWGEGNPFAWHLALESRVLFSSDGIDYLRQLEKPAPYINCKLDCEKFFLLFREAKQSLLSDASCLVFDLGTMFLSIRNFATCYSLAYKPHPTFSRRSALELEGDSVQISSEAFMLLERCRVLSTRGVGSAIATEEARIVYEEFPQIENWMVQLLQKVK